MENIVAFNCNQFWVKECVCLLLGLSYDSLRAYHLAPFSPLSECKQGGGQSSLRPHHHVTLAPALMISIYLLAQQQCNRVLKNKQEDTLPSKSHTRHVAI